MTKIWVCCQTRHIYFSSLIHGHLVCGDFTHPAKELWLTQNLNTKNAGNGMWAVGEVFELQLVFHSWHQLALWMDSLRLGSRGTRNLSPLSYMREMSRADLLPSTFLRVLVPVDYKPTTWPSSENPKPSTWCQNYHCQNVFISFSVWLLEFLCVLDVREVFADIWAKLLPPPCKSLWALFSKMSKEIYDNRSTMFNNKVRLLQSSVTHAFPIKILIVIYWNRIISLETQKNIYS